MFDQAFRIFWRKRALIGEDDGDAVAAGAADASRETPKPGGAARRRRRCSPATRARAAKAARVSRSTPVSPSPTARSCRSKDFAQMTAAEIAAAKDAIARLVLPLDEVQDAPAGARPRTAA